MDEHLTTNSKQPLISRRRFLSGAALLGGVLLADGFLRQPTALEVRQTRLPISKMPPGRQLRIAHLSDLHLHRFDDYYRQVAETTNALEPDIILLTGDYVEEKRNLPGVLAFLDSLKAPAGIYAVQGNWEYWALIEGQNLQGKFDRQGVRLLLNEQVDIDWNGIPLSLLGIDFPSSSASVQRLGALSSHGRINIALSHVPAFQHELLGGKADLILCGHTHGGQVRLPVIKPFHLPRYSGPYVDGLYRVGDVGTPLFVTRGIGTSILPIRMFCPPEINLLTLYRA